MKNGITNDEGRAINKFIQAMEEFTPINWIVAQKQLPEHGKPVRVFRNGGYVGIDNYSVLEKKWVSYDDIVCWHELLDPPIYNTYGEQI